MQRYWSHLALIPALVLLTASPLLVGNAAHSQTDVVYDEETGLYIIEEFSIRPPTILLDEELGPRAVIPIEDALQQIELLQSQIRQSLPYENYEALDPDIHFENQMTKVNNELRMMNYISLFDVEPAFELYPTTPSEEEVYTSSERADTLSPSISSFAKVVATLRDGNNSSWGMTRSDEIRKWSNYLARKLGGEGGGWLGGKVLTAFFKIDGKYSTLIVKRGWQGRVFVALFSLAGEEAVKQDHEASADLVDILAGDFQSEEELESWWSGMRKKVDGCFDGVGGTRDCGKFVAGTLVAIPVGVGSSTLGLFVGGPVGGLVLGQVGGEIGSKLGEGVFDGLSAKADAFADWLSQDVGEAVGRMEQ